MSATLGEKLRQAREERGISISEVAEQTRISSLYIQSIENDNYKPLPGGIFNKGFVKSYAKFIGFDEQEALQDYAILVREAENLPEEEFRSYRPEVLTDENITSSFLPTIIFAGIILALMTGGILFLVYYFSQPSGEGEKVRQGEGETVSSSPNLQVSSPSPIPPTDVPTMSNLKVEFSAVGDAVSLGSVSDGKRSDVTIADGKSVVFEPRQGLQLRYAGSRAAFARLSINGKPITPPAQPSPNRNVIEFDINSENLAQIWQSGAIQLTDSTSAQPTPEHTETPRPTAPTPTTDTTRTPRTPSNTASTPRTRPTPTPLSGRPRTVPSPTRSPN